MIWDSIGEIEKDPYNSNLLRENFKKYQRIRKGKYRIIFLIDSPEVIILKIGKRSPNL
jgi:mRNA-degrading endonuclease RelE of RelBE toxin-antitoxin system